MNPSIRHKQLPRFRLSPRIIASIIFSVAVATPVHAYGAGLDPMRFHSAVISISFFIAVAVMVGLIVWAGMRRDRQVHETARAMIQNGQPVPPALLVPVRRARSDLRRGILWISFGIGLMAYLLADGNHRWSLGFVPLLLGLGHLIAWKLEPKPQGEPRP